ncbi:hypothetical protein TUM19329_25720 [Legionella antarctica]|uniref:Fido domain-containing protein n=1 Tax=Legionella antarctica TaxID=2708020 RepID=A0A6F8T6Y3_9GAMM|nr:Fic family protein [Legionella antarctica]BCA96211.1 hypothetical protein TUM19329_25720 [Legionella antarctica]
MLNQFIYLFLTDLCRVPFQHDYKSYAKEEPGYGASMLQAYLTAFKTKKDGKITEGLIKSIHKAAMNFNPSSNPGEYKNDWGKFEIAPSTKHNLKNEEFGVPTYSVTDAGMEEFIKYWMKENHNPIHALCFEVMDNIENAPCYVFENNPKGLKYLQIMASKNSTISHVVSTEAGLELIHQLLLKLEYQCEVNCMIHEPQEKLQTLIAIRMQELITSYDKEIKLAKSDDEKLIAIVHFVQRMEQLHPFADGNIRTANILLNKLLRDHGFSLTVMMNPNSLDGFSTTELVDMVKQGQTHYQQITQHQNGNLTLLTPAAINIKLRSITCSPQELHDIEDQSLISSFIDCVIKDNPESLVTNRYCFLADKTTSKVSLILEQLSLIINVNDKKNEPFISAIKAEKFNLALRKACSEFKEEIIQIFLNDHSVLSLDFTEKSSNGKTPFDWIDVNKALSPNEKKLIKSTMLSLMSKEKLTLSSSAANSPLDSKQEDGIEKKSFSPPPL